MSIEDMILQNFNIELLNVERAFIENSKLYICNLDTKIQNFQVSIYYKQMADILDIYFKIIDNLNLDDTYKNILQDNYNTRIKILIILSNNLFNGVDIYEIKQEENKSESCYY